MGWLPKALVAGLLVLAGYAGGGVVAGALGSAAKKATGQRSIGLEKAVRWGVLAAAIILALGNLGIQTTSLQILVAGLIFTVGLSTSLIAGMGGRDVAANVAAGRTLGTELALGRHLTFGSVAGTIVKLRPAAVIIRNDDRPETTTVIPAALLLTAPFELTD